jgi:hypothetical protein
MDPDRGIGAGTETVIGRPRGTFPVLLAADETGPRADWRPVTLDAADLGKGITGGPATLRFRIGDATLLPFHEARGRYSAYLNVTWK